MAMMLIVIPLAMAVLRVVSLGTVGFSLVSLLRPLVMASFRGSPIAQSL
jgi:hypothetical protein